METQAQHNSDRSAGVDADDGYTMSPRRCGVSIGPLVCLLCVATGAVVASAAAQERADRTRRDLQVLSERSIFFGHQSVGMNLLEGVRELAAREGVALRIQERPVGTGLPPGTLAHAGIAENGDPLRKLRSFDAALAQGAGPNLALMKLCFVDVGAETDVSSLLREYEATLRRLKARHPHTTFVHVTTPLTIVQGGLKALLKWFLDRPPYGFLENVRREELNELMRRSYGGREPLFDLARVESTAPDGTPETGRWEGRATPALVSAYTDDGGHLNKVGRERAARALLAVLAAAPISSASARPEGR
jgi:hypothetical protein